MILRENVGNMPEVTKIVKQTTEKIISPTI